ncbi:helix-turn-helix domain-containing protein [Alicyclobacillus cycloheptanicus]|uniref:Helix-turn-helix domain-containing protein n=1 Tax=Alicyclobacillus cycloheptanicus TaxID=1457 RepID=A0ABT9XLE1_9BACL|nr:hypothetical protein [Alicyclobacillus cycloheptanicus]WDM01867.1 helix-turn-helix domain-containing protein [Alicyclobacillus cycloheptanicus]
MNSVPNLFNNIIDDALYTVNDISELLKVSTETVRRWFRSGSLISSTPYHFSATGADVKDFIVRRQHRRTGDTNAAVEGP